MKPSQEILDWTTKEREYPVTLLLSMLNLYSPSGSENQIASFLYSELRRNGLETKIDPAGNVIGEIGTGRPRILLCGHMDTIPGLLPVKVEDDRVYGRGAVDAKSSLASMVVACLQAIGTGEASFHATLVGVVEEETSTKGIQQVISDHQPYDLAVFGEPSGSRNVTIGYKGHLRARLSCSTRGGHSASPWISRNSFDEAVKLWTKLESSFFTNGEVSKFNALTGCVTKMAAGNDTNTIPATAQLDLDIRIPPGLTIETVEKRVMRLCLDQETQSGGDLVVSASFENRCPAFLGKNDSTSVRAFRMAIRQLTGQQATLIKKTGTSDMNLLAEEYNIPMVAYGPGNSALDHTDNEHVSIPEYLESIRITTIAIRNMVRLYNNGSPEAATPLQHIG
jgi:LysW-gamma-L-lysine carboxypeptidase